MDSEQQNISSQSIPYAVTFVILAGVFIWMAVTNGGPSWMLTWPALSLLLVAAAYGGIGAAVFAKRNDGTRAVWSTLCLFPYLLILWLGWSLYRLVTREPYCSEIIPGLWLGRRPYPYELPPQTTCVVDLACEFSSARGLTAKCDYLSLPTLDTSVPTKATFQAAIEQVATQPGSTYVHCALGHGRSAMFVAAMLLARGIARTPDEALKLIQNVRPAIRLSLRQLIFLEQFNAK